MTHRLKDVPHQHLAFYTRNGRQFRSLKQMASELPKMPNESFVHHVNAVKNDFVSWVQNVIGDERLASQLEGIRDKRKMAQAVKLRIRELQQKKTIDESVKKLVHSIVFGKTKVLKTRCPKCSTKLKLGACPKCRPSEGPKCRTVKRKTRAKAAKRKKASPRRKK